MSAAGVYSIVVKDTGHTTHSRAEGIEPSTEESKLFKCHVSILWLSCRPNLPGIDTVIDLILTVFIIAMPVGSQSPTLMEFVRHLEGQDNDLMSQHEPRDDTDTSVTEALTSLRIEEADVQPVQEARPPVRFSDTLQLANLAQMLNDLAADPSFTIQGIPPDDWPRWKDHLKSDVRAVMPVARKEDMDRRLVDAWKTTFPNSAVPGSVIRKIKIGVKELRRHQAVEDGERGPGVTRDEYFELAM
jgi:hypothetical protein